jgi:hypothetical protein
MIDITSGLEVEVTHRVTFRVHTSEIPEATLRAVLDHMRPDSTVTVRLIEGGSQREPVTAGYVLTVDLSKGATA